ncbi:hypothetical protein, partial [Sulfitobacter sp.]|uniref:hypothetical protein n=1 Tax=Sulfitobacter sp. TaxID=1903071 RepID=UPI00300303B7
MDEKKSIGTGITKSHWNLAETDEEIRASMQALASETYSGDFARAVRVAENFSKTIIESSKNLLVFEDSPQAFAHKILQGIRVAHHSIAKGDADLAAMMAFHAGVAWERARMKWAWEQDALRGEKFSKSNGETNRTEQRKVMLRTVLKLKWSCFLGQFCGLAKMH